MAHILKVGTSAPEIALADQNGDLVSITDLRGGPVVLAFYPGDWTPVCGDQMVLYNEVLPVFQQYGAELLGISVDSRWCHAAFAADRRLRFRLLSDFEPKGAVARRYNAYRDQDGTTERALFVIDPVGIVSWSYLSPIDINPGAEGILEALESMRKGVAL